VLTVRQSTYRGQPGWLVSGTLPDRAFRVRVFALHKSAAEHIRSKILTGQHITPLDFQPRNPE